MIAKLKTRLSNIHRDIWLFIIAVAITGFSVNIVESTFNNYLNDTFGISGMQRSVLELPRELPGFSVVFVSALLCFLPGRKLAAFSMLLQIIGLLLIAFFSKSFPVMLVWLFILSLGQHIFMPLQSSIGMELAKEGQEGRRLGQFSSIRNFTAIAGSFIVFIGFRYLHFTYQISFVIAAAGLIFAALCFMYMSPTPTHNAKLHLKLHKEYKLFYWLSVLYGTRKQIFITFAPWVLVTVYGKPTYIVAWLFTVGGVAGIFFQPFLGWMIDSWGERFVLAAEALLLVGVCSGYGFAKDIFPKGETAYYVAAACYVADMLLISASMARATYLKKIAIHPSHVAPSLTMGVTIDHAFSISIALAAGFIWYRFGYQYVFLLGTMIAAINFMSALQIRIPCRTTAR